jgi:hypothetical protein
MDSKRIHKNGIESIQKRVTKYICIKSGFPKLTYSERLSKLNLKQLSVRRKLKTLKYLFKCIYNHKDVPLLL